MNKTSTHHSMGFQQLAVQYFPYITPASASVRLKQWIMTTPELLKQLISANYRPGARLLTPRQVDLITTEFGEP